jgi:acyl-CoA synthetase (NDP forming)/RimJ/RimL family protein N-acetyltransferase
MPSEVPTTWSGDVVLADGGPVHVRPIRPGDRERYREFHERQSPDSVYYRYFSARPRLSDAELDRIVNVDMIDRAALVAFERDELIGIASYERWPGRTDAEVAFFVDDTQRGRGLATVLLELLAVVAREHGITRFTAEVLADNRSMLKVFMRAGFPVQRAFDSGVVDVEFPLEATPHLLDAIERREQSADARSLSRVLFPRAIAVIGASDEVGSPGWAVFRNLLGSGYPGPLYPVNPHRAHVANVACVGDVTAIDGPVDLAVVAVPADVLHDVVRSCAAKRVRGLVVVTDVSTADPPLDVAAIVAFARRNGMRVIGPGSMGVLVTGDAPLRAHLAYVRGAPAVTPGHVAVSLQSGPLGAAVIDHARRLGLGLSTFVSLGDKADVSGNDLLQYIEDDHVTRVVAMYTESFGNPLKFARIARRVARTKAIIAVRAGPAAHSEAVEGLYEQAGVIPVRTVRELLDTARVLADQPLPRGRRVAVLTNAREPATLALDALRRAGLEPVELSESTWAELDAGPLHARRLPGVVDLTWRAVPADYRQALSLVLGDPRVDAVVVIHAPPVPQALDGPAVVIDEVSRGSQIPVVAVMLGGHEGPVVAGSPVPAFDFPEPAAAVLGRVVALAEWRASVEADVAEPPSADLEGATAVIQRALRARPEGTLVNVADTQALLRAHGLSVAEARAVTSLEAALDGADEIGYPVALKALGVPRRGRGTTGGITLDLHSRAEVEGAWHALGEALGETALSEAMVQAMVPAGVEVRLAIEVDPSLGPVVAVGLGGVHAAAIGDRHLRLAPFGPRAAADLVASSRAADAMHTLGIDPAWLVDAVHRMSHLADQHHEVDRVELNPVIVSEAGAWVTDPVVHVRPVEAVAVDLPRRQL